MTEVKSPVTTYALLYSNQDGEYLPNSYASVLGIAFVPEVLFEELKKRFGQEVFLPGGKLLGTKSSKRVLSQRKSTKLSTLNFHPFDHQQVGCNYFY